MKVKPLLVYWRPKDIQPVLDGIKEIPCDKLFLNYMPYPYNYEITTAFFKTNPEYTHLICLPNDLVPTRKVYDKLVKHIEEKDYAVISGVCNWDTEKYKDYLNITADLPALKYNDRFYHKISKDRYPNTLLKVPWDGFSFMFIRRDIVFKVPFPPVCVKDTNGERPIWETRGGFGGDLCWAHNLDYYGIEQYADTGCNMEHLRFYGKMLVGVKPPSIEFFKYNGKNLEHGEQNSPKSEIQSSSQSL